jgi:hypothetical protein
MMELAVVNGSDNSLEMRLLPLNRLCVLDATEKLSKLDVSVSLLSLIVEYLFMVGYCREYSNEFASRSLCLVCSSG